MLPGECHFFKILDGFQVILPHILHVEINKSNLTKDVNSNNNLFSLGVYVGHTDLANYNNLCSCEFCTQLL